MSTFSDIETWVSSQLVTEVSALRTVKAIATPEEFQLVGRNAPSAGVLVIAGDTTDEIILGTGDQLITIDVGIWVSARAFRGGENLSEANGIHDLFDDIWTAFKNQTPTSAFDPFRYVGHRLESIDNGLAVMSIQLRTAAVI